jgi:CRP-like cAMP-binding protein
VRLEWIDPAVCSLDYRLKIIGRLPFFRHLPPEVIVDINRLFEDRDVAAERAIYYEGDLAEHLYLVAMGKVKLTRHTAQGREVLLDILRGGDYFGSLGMPGGHGYGETAIAQTDCCIL